MDCRTDGAKFDVANRAGYLFNSTIAGIDEADAILLVGTNPRHEATMINTRIRRAVFERRVPVALIGERADLSYQYVHAGSNLQDLENLAKDKKAQIKAEKPMMIVGSGVFEREDGEAVHHALFKVAEDLGVVKEGWNGFNILHRAASRVGALDAGFVPQGGGKDFEGILAGTKDGSIKALYLLGADEFSAHSEIGWKCFTIYQGHHGDHGAARADVVLPGAAYTEKDGIYVNTEGRVQYARRAAFPPGEAKEDWKILRKLSEVLGRVLPYDTQVQLRERIFGEFAHFAAADEIKPAKWGAFGVKGKSGQEPFVNPVVNYYMTNAICRASHVMRDCTLELLETQDERLEAAE
jgi:NADH-quinone oxidoreductase subunit G